MSSVRNWLVVMSSRASPKAPNYIKSDNACMHNYLQVASSKPALRMFNCILLHLVFYNKATKDGAKRKSFQFACYLHVRVSAF